MSPIHRLLVHLAALMHHQPSTTEHQVAKAGITEIQASNLITPEESSEVDKVIMAANVLHSRSTTTNPPLPVQTVPPAPLSLERAAEMEYEAGYNIGIAGGNLPDSSSEDAKDGYSDGRVKAKLAASTPPESTVESPINPYPVGTPEANDWNNGVLNAGNGTFAPLETSDQAYKDGYAAGLAQKAALGAK